MTAHGITAVLKRIDYHAMKMERFKSIAEATNTTVDNIIKSGLYKIGLV
jgi:hypothetical protein